MSIEQFRGVASTLPFRVKDLAHFEEHLRQFVGVHLVVVDASTGLVFMEGTHGNWNIYTVATMVGSEEHEMDLVDLDSLVSLTIGEGDAVTTETLLADGEYVMFQWMTVTDGAMDSGIYVVNSGGETLSRTLNDMVAQAHAAMGLPEDDSPMMRHAQRLQHGDEAV